MLSESLPFYQRGVTGLTAFAGRSAKQAPFPAIIIKTIKII
jgi:hypothetical protein